MGKDDPYAAIGYIAMCCVAGRGLKNYRSTCFSYPGIYANFFINGVLGFFHHQSGHLKKDFQDAYVISCNAARYLALPFLNADLRRCNASISTVHMLSGVLPFGLTLVGKCHDPMGNVALGANIISLCFYSYKRDRVWGWITAGAACLAYFVAPQTCIDFMTPLSLAFLNYCSYWV